MINLKIKNVKQFEFFLGIITKFSVQCQLNVSKVSCQIYCKNSISFNSARLDLFTDLIYIEENSQYQNIKICLRDVNALKSSINIITLIQPQKEQIILNAEQIITPQNVVYIKKIIYKGKTNFSLITIDQKIIQNYIAKEISTDLSNGVIWKFNIDPKKLDIAQNRTGNIVNIDDDVSVYLTQHNKSVLCALLAKHSTYNNSIVIPIGDSIESSLNEIKGIIELCIGASTFRIINILKVNQKQHLYGQFNRKFMTFKFESDITTDKYYIKAKVLTNLIKGK